MTTIRGPGFSAQDYQERRTAQRLTWVGRLRIELKQYGLDERLALDQLDRQDFTCPICLKRFDPHARTHARPRIDIDDEGRPRGFLCGWCHRYIKAVEGDPLRAPKPHRHPLRKKRTLIYLKVIEPEV